MPVAPGREADRAALAMMLDENRARCLAPQAEPTQARPWIAFFWRIQKIECAKCGQRKGDVRRLCIGEKRRRLAPDQPGIDIAGAESFEITERRQELTIGDKPGMRVLFRAASSRFSASSRVAPCVMILAIMGS